MEMEPKLKVNDLDAINVVIETLLFSLVGSTTQQIEDGNIQNNHICL